MYLAPVLTSLHRGAEGANQKMLFHQRNQTDVAARTQIWASAQGPTV